MEGRSRARIPAEGLASSHRPKTPTRRPPLRPKEALHQQPVDRLAVGDLVVAHRHRPQDAPNGSACSPEGRTPLAPRGLQLAREDLEHRVKRPVLHTAHRPPASRDRSKQRPIQERWRAVPGGRYTVCESSRSPFFGQPVDQKEFTRKKPAWLSFFVRYPG